MLLLEVSKQSGQETVWGYIFQFILPLIALIRPWLFSLDLVGKTLRSCQVCDSLGSPCGSEVHKKITVIDPWHPDQLLILGHGLATRRGERLQLWELGLIRCREKEKERDRWCHTTKKHASLKKISAFNRLSSTFYWVAAARNGDRLVAMIQCHNTTKNCGTHITFCPCKWKKDVATSMT